MPVTRRSIHCDYCGVQGGCFLRSSANSETLARIEADRRSVQLGRGEILYRPDDLSHGFWVLCTGRIKTYRISPQGKALITGVVEPGEVFGVTAGVTRGKHQEYAEALSPAVAAFVDSRALDDILARDAKFARVLLEKLAVKVDEMQVQALNLAYGSARERLTDILAQMQVAAEREADTGWVNVRRQDLAERSGLTIETTVRALKEMERQGEIETEGRRIRLVAVN